MKRMCNAVRVTFIVVIVTLYSSAFAQTESPKIALTFKWGKVKDAVKYIIEISEEENFSTILIRKEVTLNKYSMKVSDPKNYHYRIASVDKNGVQSKFSNPKILKGAALKKKLKAYLEFKKKEADTKLQAEKARKAEETRKKAEREKKRLEAEKKKKAEKERRKKEALARKKERERKKALAEKRRKKEARRKKALAEKKRIEEEETKRAEQERLKKEKEERDARIAAEKAKSVPAARPVSYINGSAYFRYFFESFKSRIDNPGLVRPDELTGTPYWNMEIGGRIQLPRYSLENLWRLKRRGFTMSGEGNDRGSKQGYDFEIGSGYTLSLPAHVTITPFLGYLLQNILCVQTTGTGSNATHTAYTGYFHFIEVGALVKYSWWRLSAEGIITLPISLKGPFSVISAGIDVSGKFDIAWGIFAGAGMTFRRSGAEKGNTKFMQMVTAGYVTAGYKIEL